MIVLAACTEPYPLAPDLVASGAAAPYPALVPAGEIVAQVPAATAATAPAGAIGTRADRLRARANRLRGPVIDAGTGERMRRGIDG
jgi:hypothetical protein